MKKPLKGLPLALCVFLLLSLQLSYTTQAEDWVYSVRKGDTLWDLCEKYTTKKNCWLKIGPYNGVEYPKIMPPGTRIRFPVEWLKAAPSEAELVYVKGEVFLVKKRQDIPAITAGSGTPMLLNRNSMSQQPGKVGDKIKINQRLITGENSTASVRFADGTTMVVEEKSQIKFDALSKHKASGMVDSKINLQHGATKTFVPPRQPRSAFSISTPSAVAAVRGTEFRVTSVSSTPPYTLSEVYTGSVAATPPSKKRTGSEVMIPAGYGLKAVKGQPIPQPRALLAAPTIVPHAVEQHFPFTLSWQALELASQYRIDILEKAEIEKWVSSIYSNTPSIEIDNLPDGCYHYHIRGRDQDGLQGMRYEGAFCGKTILLPPVLEKNIIQNPITGGFKLSWSEVKGANSYILEVSPDKDFAKHIANYNVLDNSFNVPNIKAKKLFFRVKAKSTKGIYSLSSNIEKWERKRDYKKMLAPLGTVALAILIVML